MNNKEIAVSVKEISKNFVLPKQKNTTLKHTLINMFRKNKKTNQKVLDRVSFDVYKGDFFGIVGRNGSGKSTLLKLIAGVYSPNSGHVTIDGGLTPFIELGVGFNPELSGRDNVFLNGAILGFERKEIESMYKEIVEFAELESFMDQKLKNYSSGMQVRLAFSIAIKAKNDILIFDEVLAVGDEAFQQKCLSTFDEYKRKGQTVILVTHDMNMVKRYCNRAVLIGDGSVINIGKPRSVAEEYSSLNDESIETQLNKDSEKNKNTSYDKSLITVSSESKKIFKSGGNFSLIFNLKNLPKLSQIESVGVNIYKKSGEHITGENSRSFIANLSMDEKIKLVFKLEIQPGEYFATVGFFRTDGSLFKEFNNGLEFVVRQDDNYNTEWCGLARLSHEWSIINK